MALFGSKKKTDAASSAPDATATATAPAPATVVKEKKVRPSRGAVRNGTIVGLNIGNANIKAVEVVAKNGELSVARAASVPTPPDAFQNGNVLSVSALANAIKALWKVGGFKGKAVISSVAGTGALVVRVIEVPMMTDAQLADAMRADAQLYIPFPPTEVQMDFKALRELPSDPDSGTMDVLLAAAQSEIIDLHIKTLQAAKLDPRAVDVEPIAAGRTLNLQKRGDFNGLVVDYNEITAIANIGAFGTEISLLRGDVLVFTRTVSTGGNTISQGIADALGLTFGDGEHIKIEQGDALPPEGYQSGQASGDEFGFGDTGTGFGGDFEDFGLDDASSTSTNRTTVLDAPAQNESADPFDLDFFNQGPKNEPGAGHAQKEGQPDPGSAFSFDDLSLLPATPASAPENAPNTSANSAPTTSETGAAGFNFDFDMPLGDLPSSAPSPATSTPAPSTSAADVAVPTPVSAPTSSAIPFAFGGADQGLANDVLPSTDPVASPVAATSAPPAPIPSAFDFSDFDLPATVSASSPSTPVAPVGAAPIAPAAFQTQPAPESVPQPAPESVPLESGGFSFGDLPEILPTTTPSATTDLSAPNANEFNFGEPALTLEKPAFDATTSSPETPLPVADTPGASGLDMSDIFGATPAPTTSGGMNFDDLNLGSPSDGGLNLGDMGGQDDFGFGGGEEFGGFGAGLSGAGDAGSAAIYDALANSIEELAGEISRSLSFYLERVPDAALSRIYLTGGGALLKNLDVFLTGRLGAPTSLLNPLQMLPVAAQSEIQNGPLYTVALGLALRDFVD